MKEDTKYNNYRFIGKINIEEIQPWFDFDRGKPWDEREVPWPLENKVRREILITLAREGPLTFTQLQNYIRFAPQPLLLEKDEYTPKVRFIWSEHVIENHLLNLEWYSLIQKRDDKYEITFPVLQINQLNNLDKYINRFAEDWIKIIKETKKEVQDQFSEINKDGKSLYQILMDKTIDKLYNILKSEGLLPQESNIKALWAEQLREKKFERWVKDNF
ncbi:MAG: hypothetical protein BAJALOKI1v1_240006 [Promethearchaeota archaeon]|nr:MAG: hypothetical protein BAJALOKI1v1_240006 [Candidatus Lokiarchaeota archaeon]